MQHLFDINIAQKYDVNVAIFLNNLAFWVQRKKANNKHYFDGHYWVYNSVDAYTLLFPYWTYKQLRTIIKKCVDEGLILEGNYNQSPYDRTKWYTLSKKGLELFHFPSCPNGQIMVPQRADISAPKGRAIPDIKPDIKKEKEMYKEKEKPKRRKPETCLPENYAYNETHQIIAKESNVDINHQLELFKDYALQNDRRVCDWDAAFRMWLRKAKTYSHSTSQSSPVRMSPLVPSSSRPTFKPTNEIRSTVPEFGPGHPTWEANQEWRRKNESQGSETTLHHARGTDMRKATEYLF